jgi:amino acid transporter
VLTGFYALVALGVACVRLPDGALPQLVLADGVARVAVAPVIALSLLASFTSFNGGLLGLSRFLAALAAQGVLPRALGRIEPRTLVPRAALDALALASLAATGLAAFALGPTLIAAAAAVALVYAGCAWVRQRAPFAEPGRTRSRRLFGRVLSLALTALAVGLVLDGGAAVAALVGGAAAIALALGSRVEVAHAR